MKEVIMYNHLWFNNKKESLIWHAQTRTERHCDTPTSHVSHIFNIIYKLMWTFNISKYTYHNELLSVTLRGKKVFKQNCHHPNYFFSSCGLYSGPGANCLDCSSRFSCFEGRPSFSKELELSGTYIQCHIWSWITVQNYFWYLKIRIE